jgi:Cu2+-containing amine oxidase
MYNISGTLHTHVLAWKVDLDIGGTQNSVNIHHMKVRLTTLHAAAGGLLCLIGVELHRELCLRRSALW